MKIIKITIETEDTHLPMEAYFPRNCEQAKRVSVEVTNDMAGPAKAVATAAPPATLPLRRSTDRRNGSANLREIAALDHRVVLERVPNQKGVLFDRLDVPATLRNLGITEEDLLTRTWSFGSLEGRVRSALYAQRRHIAHRARASAQRGNGGHPAVQE